MINMTEYTGFPLLGVSSSARDSKRWVLLYALDQTH